MEKRHLPLALLVTALLTLPLNGCVALLAGAGGTVLWQGGKAISEEPVSMARAVDAAKSVLRSEKITLKEEVTKKRSTQLRGERPDGANVNVDVLSTGPKTVRLEVRVGIGEKSGARDLLQKIKQAL